MTMFNRLRKTIAGLRRMDVRSAKQERVRDLIAGSTGNALALERLAYGIADRREALETELAELRERCASDPWWWAFAEYLDEGWCGPFETREQARASAEDAIGETPNGEMPEISFRQHRNAEGCIENERLETELAHLREENSKLKTQDTVARAIVGPLVDDLRMSVQRQRGVIQMAWIQLDCLWPEPENATDTPVPPAIEPIKRRLREAMEASPTDTSSSCERCGHEAGGHHQECEVPAQEAEEFRQQELTAKHESRPWDPDE